MESTKRMIPFESIMIANPITVQIIIFLAVFTLSGFPPPVTNINAPINIAITLATKENVNNQLVRLRRNSTASVCSEYFKEMDVLDESWAKAITGRNVMMIVERIFFMDLNHF